MNGLVLALLTAIGYVVAYLTYGRYLSRKVFKINPAAQVPSKRFEDGHDYVPSKRQVVFGHHFTSIAGTGPIVGPAIGIIWGWVPAVIWVFFGSILMGAVHDFASLMVSLRNQGKSITDITAKYINPRVRLMFFSIVFMALLIVMAIFGLVISVIFAKFPQSVFPIWIQLPIALVFGRLVYRRGGNLVVYTLLSIILMYGSIWIGNLVPFSMPAIAGIPSTGVWTLVLLSYAFIASTLPVTTLLQPRDYLNAWQLYVSMGLLLVGIGVTGFTRDFTIVAPAVQSSPIGAPPMLPFLFITIACGAISGFHCLVSSGTSSKQLESETDARFVGYGSMLIEGFLAILMIIACTAGVGLAYTTMTGQVLTGAAAWQTHYSSWQAVSGLGSKLAAVIVGCSNIVSSIGLPTELGVAIFGVFIAAFAGTTLDTATRIQRYIFSELCSHVPAMKWGQNKWAATSFVVILAALLAFSSGADGKGALSLWPLFGATNQLLASVALLIGTLYLRPKGGLKFLITGIPCVFMIGMTLWATLFNQISFFRNGLVMLSAINIVILALAIAVFVEGIRKFWSPATPEDNDASPSPHTVLDEVLPELHIG